MSATYARSYHVSVRCDRDGKTERGWDFEVLAKTELRAALALLGEK